MARLALWLLFVPLAAVAQTPGVSAHARARTALTTQLTVTAPEGVCDASLVPAEWSDPSSAWTFAAHPTARLDDQELAATQLRGLIEIKNLQLFVLGSRVTSVRLSFSHAGWRPRWPFC